MKVLIIFGTDGGGLVGFKLADDDDADDEGVLGHLEMELSDDLVYD